MPLTPPLLDDRTFDDLFEEARARIPRYTPEWTNHNDSDPGITLLQLFAWMTETLLYRVNQVPELNYVKFLQLLGVEPTPAQPARTELTFKLTRPDVDTVVVPKGTQVGVDGTSPPVVFETDSALVALGATLAAVQVFDGFDHADLTSANAAGSGFATFGPLARAGAALMLGFDTPLAFTSADVDLAFFVTGLEPKPLLADLASAPLPLPATIAWEYWGGFDSWVTAVVDGDATRAFTQSGHVTVRGPGAAAVKAQLGAVSSPLYWLRARLVASSYEQPPQLERVLTNTVPATAAQTVVDETVGGANGRPSQQLRLANAPVVALDKPLVVPARDDGGITTATVTVTTVQLAIQDRPDPTDPASWQIWQEVDDLYASGPDDAVFVLDRSTGDILFGDGTRGMIPTALAGNPTANIVARLYRYGGGSAGNSPAGTATSLLGSVAGVDSVTNVHATAGGTDEESVDDAKLRAPSELKSRSRAVTAEDYVALAEEAPGANVGRACALPLTHPNFPGAQIPGVVTVVVVPNAPGRRPTPNETTLAAVCAYLNAHRVVTTELYVAPPAYSEVQIQADVVASADADLAAVRDGVVARLNAYFDPLIGGDDGTGWPFGGTIFYSSVYREIFAVPGVERVRDNDLTILIDGNQAEPCRDVPIANGALLFCGEHTINVSYEAGS
jgi:predicted phage baseplate assembly protein